MSSASLLVTGLRQYVNIKDKIKALEMQMKGLQHLLILLMQAFLFRIWHLHVTALALAQGE